MVFDVVFLKKIKKHIKKMNPKILKLGLNN